MPAVALVANMTWNIWNYRKPVIKALQDAGYQVLVFAPVDDSLPKLLRETGVTFIPLEEFRRNSTRLGGTLRMLLEFIQIYRKYRPALVLHFGVQANILGTMAAAVCNISSICVVTGLGYTYLHRNWINSIVHVLYRFTFRQAGRVIFENEQDRHFMVQTRTVQQDKTAVVSGCGIEASDFLPMRRRRSNKRLVFAYFGRLLYDKGLRELYEAACIVRRHFPNTEFRFFGTLDKTNPAHIRPSELLYWIKSGVIRYMGVVEDVRPYLAESDVVVLPSYREGLSRTLLEAMAMARPILVTDVPGCRETVVHTLNGLVVPPRNASALAEAMMHFCAMTDQERDQMGLEGRRIALRDFAGADVGAQYLRIVESALIHVPLQPYEKSTDYRNNRSGRGLSRRTVDS
ncbi:MAG: glycosyltransferase family 4 protein [Saprospiraceae bacterium]|nr:glycosyltransferase family 4 protein [Saprospiraceae bacterium]